MMFDFSFFAGGRMARGRKLAKAHGAFGNRIAV